FIVRAVEGEPSANYCATGSPFSDVPPTHPMCKYIKRLSELGITTGYSDGTYRPTNTVNRTQMAAFLARAFLGMN
ncbi:MAG: S-layer homology domain-containing protein, partial [Deltaproteobacteria bacterium]|nr:S-layer homology domain-containing protein [Deltaproteobacteria bacterium]